MVGILGPLFAVDLAEGLWHEDAEVGGQVGKGMLSQLGHRVRRDVEGVQAGAAAEGGLGDALQRVGQRDGLQVLAVMESACFEFLEFRKLVEVLKPRNLVVFLEEVSYTFLL